MVDVIVNESGFGGMYGLLNRVQLLRQIEAWAAGFDHFDHLAQVALCALQTVGDGFVGFVFHRADHIPPEGICKARTYLCGQLPPMAKNTLLRSAHVEHSANFPKGKAVWDA